MYGTKKSMFSSGRVGLGSVLNFESLVLPRLMYSAAESWDFTEAQGAKLGDLPLKLGLHRGPSTTELLASTTHTSMADLP